MRAKDHVCLLRSFFLCLIATLVIERAQDRFLALTAFAACRSLNIGANRFCRGNGLQVQAQRLASGEIVGLPRLPKRSCNAVRQTMPRLLAQFVGRDENDNTVRDALAFRLLLAGLFCRIRLFSLLNVIDDTNASSLGLSDASRDADCLQHRTTVALMMLNCDRHLPIDRSAQ
ncbi:hypothetical protein [Bradyrhizobium sp. DN5]|uniref:hypothetical protein n=1 Tax=Bradyrhizobium sp. DN5 TaxID=3056950 RepID=UPI0035256C76